MTDEMKEIIIEQMDSMRAELARAYTNIGVADAHLDKLSEYVLLLDNAQDKNVMADIKLELVKIRNALKKV